MIEIRIKTDGKEVLDAMNNKNCTLEETAIVLYRLEQIKQKLLDKEFESIEEISEEDE